MPDPGDELIDVVDDEDRVVGRRTRAEVRRHNLPHRSVYILVFNGAGELFVHRRTDTKDVYPGYHDVAIGGVVGAGESYADAAARELREELGIPGDAIEPLFSIRYRDVATAVNGMVFRCVHDGPFVLQASEIVSGEFLPTAVVEERMGRERFCPDGRAVLARYRRHLDGAKVLTAPRRGS
jgi:isopentenyldiphosphate isomerase